MVRVQPGNILEAELTGPAKQGEKHAGRTLRRDSEPLNKHTNLQTSQWYKKEVKSQSLGPMQKLKGSSFSYTVSYSDHTLSSHLRAAAGYPSI